MIKDIVHDPMFLSQRSLDASPFDAAVITDLSDTLMANSESCVGMAANMIGVLKRIIIFESPLGPQVMVNPVITKKTGGYEAEEGCLSLAGTRKTLRYRDIEVEFLDGVFKKKKQKYSGYTAEIIQHEIDHCDGILI